MEEGQKGSMQLAREVFATLRHLNSSNNVILTKYEYNISREHNMETFK
jgi:hypothetical protein